MAQWYSIIAAIQLFYKSWVKNYPWVRNVRYQRRMLVKVKHKKNYILKVKESVRYLCRASNSPASSHQSWASDEKCLISSSSTVGLAMGRSAFFLSEVLLQNMLFNPGHTSIITTWIVRRAPLYGSYFYIEKKLDRTSCPTFWVILLYREVCAPLFGSYYLYRQTH